jgi:LuxR family transcriptional regulator, maltose regulon positive regulatory protein
MSKNHDTQPPQRSPKPGPELQALALVEQFGQHTAREGSLHFYLARTYYAWNRLEAAAGSLHQVLRIAHDWQQTDLLIVRNLFSAQLALARRDLAAAEQALQQAEELVQHERFAIHRFLVVAVRALYWLAAGDLAAASTWAEQVQFSPQTWNPNRHWEFLMLMRVYLAQRQYTRVRQGGKGEHARAVAARLLALTEPEGDMRVYLDLGEPMRQVLQSLLGAPRSQENGLTPASAALARKLLAAWGKADSRKQTAERSRAEFSALRSQLSALPEPITRREQEILRLLIAGASNQEIASELVISLATVKKHVSNLLGKLGVESRTQAIARVRDWSHLV